MLDRVITRLLPFFAWVVGVAITALIFFLVGFALPVFLQHQHAVLRLVWAPEQGHIGILAMVVGSALIALLALLLAFPICIGVVSFLLVYRHTLWALWLRRLVRLMAGIPTVVYGICAIFLLLPLLRETLVLGSGFCLLSAALSLVLLILPAMVMTLEPHAQMYMTQLMLPATGLGMSPWQILHFVIFPRSNYALLSAGLLGFSRAIGDTMLPLMLAGNAPQLPQSVFDSVRTLTAHISLVLSTAQGSDMYHSLFAAGFLLLLLTLIIQLGIARLKYLSHHQAQFAPMTTRHDLGNVSDE